MFDEYGDLTKKDAQQHRLPNQNEADKDKHTLYMNTFYKWQRTYKKEHESLSWLCCDVNSDDKTLVSKLWCAVPVCRKYEANITGHKNFSRVWLDGSGNHKISNILDHSKSEQHKLAMMLLRKDQARSKNDPITSYSPVAHSLLSSSMDSTVRKRVKKKFEISFMLAKEYLPFTKYPAIHELEEMHRVDLGQTYRNCDSASSFVHYITESQRQDFHRQLSSCRFYSMLMDGSVDKGRVENELMVILYCDREDT